ncbi:LysR family transcriptional regulator [Asaia siamensis]
MTLEQLRIFIAVAERQHMTRAAEVLALTQSAVSHAIMTLENSFGLRLFDRVGRRILLTDAGKTFLQEARAVQARALAARACLEDLGGLRAGRLHVWASQTLASYWLPARLNRFAALYPDVTLGMTISNTEEICAQISAGTISFGLIEGASIGPSVRTETLARDQLLLVVGPDHPWAESPPEISALDQTPWVLREKGSGTRASFENALQGWGLATDRLDIVMELPSNEAIATMVSTGRAATVLSASVVSGLIENGLLCPVSMPFPDRHFALACGARSLSPAEQAFCALLRGDASRTP